ncbi:hypothetical protein EJQ19_18690 [Paenibacillus whitsoniae]|uniref:Uncharacterized protein n=1 Tax=Paenibacillus whitsoniae TaxID=2496558 RepID=A0A3S0AMY7_9BACL|nr:hypothetical protein EJQ19_18690 [Paenibacillus whitsoniae]
MPPGSTANVPGALCGLCGVKVGGAEVGACPAPGAPGTPEPPGNGGGGNPPGLPGNPPGAPGNPPGLPGNPPPGKPGSPRLRGS